MAEKHDAGFVPSRYQPATVCTSAHLASVASSARGPTRAQRRDQLSRSVYSPPFFKTHQPLFTGATDSVDPGACLSSKHEFPSPLCTSSRTRGLGGPRGGEAPFRCPVDQGGRRNYAKSHEYSSLLHLIRTEGLGHGSDAQKEAAELTNIVRFQPVGSVPQERELACVQVNSRRETQGAAERTCWQSSEEPGAHSSPGNCGRLVSGESHTATPREEERGSDNESTLSRRLPASGASADAPTTGAARLPAFGNERGGYQKGTPEVEQPDTSSSRWGGSGVDAENREDSFPSVSVAVLLGACNLEPSASTALGGVASTGRRTPQLIRRETATSLAAHISTCTPPAEATGKQIPQLAGASSSVGPPSALPPSERFGLREGSASAAGQRMSRELNRLTTPELAEIAFRSAEIARLRTQFSFQWLCRSFARSRSLPYDLSALRRSVSQPSASSTDGRIFRALVGLVSDGATSVLPSGNCCLDPPVLSSPPAGICGHPSLVCSTSRRNGAATSPPGGLPSAFVSGSSVCSGELRVSSIPLTSSSSLFPASCARRRVSTGWCASHPFITRGLVGGFSYPAGSTRSVFSGIHLPAGLGRSQSYTGGTRCGARPFDCSALLASSSVAPASCGPLRCGSAAWAEARSFAGGRAEATAVCVASRSQRPAASGSCDAVSPSFGDSSSDLRPQLSSRVRRATGAFPVPGGSVPCPLFRWSRESAPVGFSGSTAASPSDFLPTGRFPLCLGASDLSLCTQVGVGLNPSCASAEGDRNFAACVEPRGCEPQWTANWRPSGATALRLSRFCPRGTSRLLPRLQGVKNFPPPCSPTRAAFEAGLRETRDILSSSGATGGQALSFPGGLSLRVEGQVKRARCGDSETGTGVFGGIHRPLPASEGHERKSGAVGATKTYHVCLFTSGSPSALDPDFAAVTPKAADYSAEFSSLTHLTRGGRRLSSPLPQETLLLSTPALRSERSRERGQARLRVLEATGFAAILGLLASSAVSCIRRGHVPRHFRLLRFAFERFRSLSDDSRAIIGLRGERAISDQCRREDEEGEAAPFHPQRQSVPAAAPQGEAAAREASTAGGEPRRRLRGARGPRDGRLAEQTTKRRRGEEGRGSESARRREEAGGQPTEGGPGANRHPIEFSGETCGGDGRDTRILQRGWRRRRPGRPGDLGQRVGGDKARGRRRAKKRARGRAKRRAYLHDWSSDSEGVQRRVSVSGVAGNLCVRPPHPASSPEPPPVLCLPSPVCGSLRDDCDDDSDALHPEDQGRRCRSATEDGREDSPSNRAERVGRGRGMGAAGLMTRGEPSQYFSMAASPLREKFAENSGGSFFASPFAGCAALAASGLNSPGARQIASTSLSALLAHRVGSPAQRLSALGAEAAMRTLRTSAQCGAGVREDLHEEVAGTIAERCRGRRVMMSSPATDASGAHGLQVHRTSFQSPSFDPSTNDQHTYYCLRPGAPAPSFSPPSSQTGVVQRPARHEPPAFSQEAGGAASLHTAGSSGLQTAVYHAHPSFPYIPSSSSRAPSAPLRSAPAVAAGSQSGGCAESPQRSGGSPAARGGRRRTAAPAPSPGQMAASSPPPHISFPLSRPPLGGMSSVSYAPPPMTERQCSAITQAIPAVPACDGGLLDRARPRGGAALEDEPLPPLRTGARRRRAASGASSAGAPRGSGRRGAAVSATPTGGRMMRRSGRRTQVAVEGGFEGAAATGFGLKELRERSPGNGQEGDDEREDDEREDNFDRGSEGLFKEGRSHTQAAEAEEGRFAVGMMLRGRCGRAEPEVKHDFLTAPTTQEDEAADAVGAPPAGGRSRSHPSLASPSSKRPRVSSWVERRLLGDVGAGTRGGAQVVAGIEEDAAGAKRHVREAPITVEDSDPSYCRGEKGPDAAGAVSLPLRVDRGERQVDREAPAGVCLSAVPRGEAAGVPSWAQKQPRGLSSDPFLDEQRRGDAHAAGGVPGDGGFGRGDAEGGPNCGSHCELLTRSPRAASAVRCRTGAEAGRKEPGRSSVATDYANAMGLGAASALPAFVAGIGGKRQKGETGGGGVQCLDSGGRGLTGMVEGKRSCGVHFGGTSTPSPGEIQRASGGPKSGAMSLISFAFLSPQQWMSEHFWKQSFEVLDHWRAADEDGDEERIFTFGSSPSAAALAADVASGCQACSPSPGGCLGAAKVHRSLASAEDSCSVDAPALARLPLLAAPGGAGGASASIAYQVGTPGTPGGLGGGRDGLGPSANRGGTLSSAAVPSPAPGAAGIASSGTGKCASHRQERASSATPGGAGGTLGASCVGRNPGGGSQGAATRTFAFSSALCHPSSRNIPTTSPRAGSASFSFLPSFASPAGVQACGLHFSGVGAGSIPATSYSRSSQHLTSGTQMVFVSLFPKEWLGRNGRLCRRNGMLKGCVRALRDVNLLEEDSALSVEAPLFLTRPSPNGGEGRLLIPRHTITLRLEQPYPPLPPGSLGSSGEGARQHGAAGCLCPSCSASIFAQQCFDAIGHNSCASSLSTASTTTHGSSASALRRTVRAGDKGGRRAGPGEAAEAGSRRAREGKAQDTHSAATTGAGCVSFVNSQELVFNGSSSSAGERGGEEQAGMKTERHAEGGEAGGGHRDDDGDPGSSPASHGVRPLESPTGTGESTCGSFSAPPRSLGAPLAAAGGLATGSSVASPVPARDACGGVQPAPSSLPTRQSSPLAPRGVTPPPARVPGGGAGGRADAGGSLTNAQVGGQMGCRRARSGASSGVEEASESPSGQTQQSVFCGSSRTTSATTTTLAVGGTPCAGCVTGAETMPSACGGGAVVAQACPQQHILVRSKPAYLLLWRYGERGTGQDPKRKWYVVTPMFIRTKWFGRYFEFYSRFQQGQLDKYKLLVVDALNRVSPKRDAIIQAWCLAGCLEATLKELGVDYQVKEVAEGPWQGFPEPTLTDEDQVIEGALRLVTDPIDELETSCPALLPEVPAGVSAGNPTSSTSFPSSVLLPHDALNGKAGLPPSGGVVAARNLLTSSLIRSAVPSSSSPLPGSPVGLRGGGRDSGRGGFASSGELGHREESQVVGMVRLRGVGVCQQKDEKRAEQERWEREHQGYLCGRGGKRRREEDCLASTGLEHTTQEQAILEERKRMIKEEGRLLSAHLLSIGCAAVDPNALSHAVHEPPRAAIDE